MKRFSIWANMFSAKERITVALATLFTVVILGTGAFALARVQEHSDDAQARAAIANCRQIELVKTEVRNSIIAGREQLEHVSYYREHPEELAKAIEDSNKTLARFAPRNCSKIVPQ